MAYGSGHYRRSGGFRSDESFECPHGVSNCYMCANKTLERGGMRPEELGFKWLDRMQARQPMYHFLQGPQAGTEHFGDDEFADINRQFMFHGLIPPRIRPRTNVVYSEPEDRASVCPHGVHNCQFCARRSVDFIHPADLGFKWLDKMVERQQLHQFPPGPQEGAEHFGKEEFPAINTLYLEDDVFIGPPLTPPRVKPKPKPKPEPPPLLQPEPPPLLQPKPPPLLQTQPKLKPKLKSKQNVLQAVKRAESALSAAKTARADVQRKAKRAQRLQEEAFEASDDEKVAALDSVAAITLKTVADVAQETASSLYQTSTVRRKIAEKSKKTATVTSKAALQMESRAVAKAKAAAEAAAAAEVAADVEEAIQSEIARVTRSKSRRGVKVQATIPAPCQAVAAVATSVSQAIDMEADRASELATAAEERLDMATEALYVAEEAEEQASQRLFNACSESYSADIENKQSAIDAVAATTVKLVAKEAAKQATMDAIAAVSLGQATTNLAQKAVLQAERTIRHYKERTQREKRPPPVQVPPPAPPRIPRGATRKAFAGPARGPQAQRPAAVLPPLPPRPAVPQGAIPKRRPVLNRDAVAAAVIQPKSAFEPARPAQKLRGKEETIFKESQKAFGGPPRKIPRPRWKF